MKKTIIAAIAILTASSCFAENQQVNYFAGWDFGYVNTLQNSVNSESFSGSCLYINCQNPNTSFHEGYSNKMSIGIMWGSDQIPSYLKMGAEIKYNPSIKTNYVFNGGASNVSYSSSDIEFLFFNRYYIQNRYFFQFNYGFAKIYQRIETGYILNNGSKDDGKYFSSVSSTQNMRPDFGLSAGFLLNRNISVIADVSYIIGNTPDEFGFSSFSSNVEIMPILSTTIGLQYNF